MIEESDHKENIKNYDSKITKKIKKRKPIIRNRIVNNNK